MNNPQHSLSEEDKRRIANELSRRIPDLSCPMCHKKNFIITDGYFNSPINANLQGMVLGGPSIPSIGIICANCGFISQHALGILGSSGNSNLKFLLS